MGLTAHLNRREKRDFQRKQALAEAQNRSVPGGINKHPNNRCRKLRRNKK
jgi:hypothetical protein